MVIDCDNEQRFKYIYSIIRGKGEPPPAARWHSSLSEHD